MKFFSDICMKCLNPQVRINKMVNKHTVDCHPILSELTSRIHSLTFLWFLMGFIFSLECFLSFFSCFLNYFARCQHKSFKLMVLRLLKNAFVSQKVKHVCSFLLMCLSKNLPHVLIITTPGRRKLPISPKQLFLYFSSAEKMKK